VVNDTKALCEARIWLAHCVFDIEVKLGLPPLEIIQALQEEQSRLINKAILRLAKEEG
jgi:hypothetical protein